MYDVFGFVSPYLIRAKVLLQDLWKDGLSWDSEVGDEVAKVFRKWESELLRLPEINVPRCLRHSNIQVKSIELCGFSDASVDAYGTMIYLRGTSTTGQIWTTFIIAKTRVAPIKQITVARLELMGAVCLVNLMQYTIEALQHIGIEVNQIHAWLDSEIALAWIAKPSSNWRTFVSNRVQQIHDLFPTNIWKFCPGFQNPADKARQTSNGKFAS